MGGHRAPPPGERQPGLRVLRPGRLRPSRCHGHLGPARAAALLLTGAKAPGYPRPTARSCAVRLFPWPRRGQARLPSAWRCPAPAPPAPALFSLPAMALCGETGRERLRGCSHWKTGRKVMEVGQPRRGTQGCASLFLGNRIPSARSCQEHVGIGAVDLPADVWVLLRGELPF